jgi:hypothetical protein
MKTHPCGALTGFSVRYTRLALKTGKGERGDGEVNRERGRRPLAEEMGGRGGEGRGAEKRDGRGSGHFFRSDEPLQPLL